MEGEPLIDRIKRIEAHLGLDKEMGEGHKEPMTPEADVKEDMMEEKPEVNRRHSRVASYNESRKKVRSQMKED